MATMQSGQVLRQIGYLFGAGTLAGLSDAQLLARFRGQRDEAAFVALLARHGPMVLAVCRGVLRDEHAAEDAFQATFLILARKSGALWAGESLGGWLHRAAHRVALRAHADAARRRERERRAGATSAERPRDEPPDDELRALLHAEIDRLPDRLRLPLVLCDLEGLTRQQAAESLRCTEGAVRGRLARARNLLRRRLTRRGVSPTALAVAAATSRKAPAAVSEALLTATARAAAGPVAASTAGALAAEFIRTLLVAKLKAALAVVLGVAALASVGGLLAFALVPAARTPDGGESQPPDATAPPAPPLAAASRDEPSATVAVRGRVVDPEGRPVERVTVRFLDPLERAKDDIPTAPSGPDGRFDLRVPRAAFDNYTPGIGKVRAWAIATARGFGFAASQIERGPEGPSDVTLRLVPDDVPIEGRLVDLEGRPLAGVRVRSRDVWFSREGNLSSWIERLRMVGSQGHWEGLDPVTLEIAATTGPDGRFRLDGIGRERLAALLASGPAIESAELNVMTRDGSEIRVPKGNLLPMGLVYHPARFTHALAPGQVIEGVVRDKDDGTPMAGVDIGGAVFNERSLIPQPGVEATTDANGRYRLTGLSPGKAYRLFATPGAGSPYPNATFRVPADAPALAPLAFDFTLKRGVLIRGRVTDKATGQPVRGYVHTYALRDNPHLNRFPGYRPSYEPSARLDDDGRFAIAALPGPGLVAVRSDVAKYLGARGAEKIKGFNKDLGSIDASPGGCMVANYHAIVVIDPDGETGAPPLEIQIDPGRSLSGTVLDPDGWPIGETMGAGLTNLFQAAFQRVESAEFVARGLDPEAPRRLVFLHEGRKLAGALRVRGDEAGPLSVRLQPWGVVTGRIVDDDGQPRTSLELPLNVGTIRSDPERGIMPGNKRFTVDRDGRFRIEGLVPGLKYQAWASDGRLLLGKVFEDVRVGPGEIRDLGDLKVMKGPIR